MKRLFPSIIFALLYSSLAFSQVTENSAELDIGLSSPNKGLVGARFSPMPWSFGIIWGSFASYADFGIAGSYHFSDYEGIYIFQSHHWLNSDKGSSKNIWEITTGGGYQHLFGRSGLLIYAELGIPFYVGNGFYRHYVGGAPTNRDKNGDMVIVSFRSGAGLGYRIVLF